MILTRDPDTRRVAARILLLQATATLVLSAIAWGAWDERHGASALAGGAIGLVANMVMTFVALRDTRTAGGALARLVVGQFAKVAVTVALLVIVARSGKVAWLPFLAAYFMTLLAFWVAPFIAARRAAAAGVAGDMGPRQGGDE